MPDFNIRSDSVNVEQIMEQIRARIREKRGVDYTEQQIHDLAAVKLERFLDPSGVRSDLLDQFRKVQPEYEPPELPNFAFEESTLFESHRAPIRWMRKLLGPLLKLLFNPNPLIQALNIQSRLNTMSAEREAKREASRRAMDQLYYELIHNLVVETTRMGIDVKNLKMRLESVSSRLEFNERRARALESAVVYKPSTEDVAVQRAPAAAVQHQRQPQREDRQPQGENRQPQRDEQRPAAPPPTAQPPSIAAQTGAAQPSIGAGPSTGSGEGMAAEGPGQRSRRRRRRRGRRGGGSAASIMGAPSAGGSVTPGTASVPIEALPDAEEDAETDSETSTEPDDASPAAATSADLHTSEARPDAPTPETPRNDPAASAETSGDPRNDAAPDLHLSRLASNTPTAAGENIGRSGESPSTGSGPGGSDPDAQ